MPVRYQLDAARNLVVGHFSGLVRPDEIIDAIQQIATETKGEALKKNALTIVDDLAQVHEIDMAAMLRIKDVMEALAKTYHGRNIRSALVARGSQHGAILKLWQASTELNPGMGTRARTFSAEADALSWLTGDGN